MKETENIPQEEKLNSLSIGDDPEALRNLGAALENSIGDLDFSEFDDEEEDWNPLRWKKPDDFDDADPKDQVSNEASEYEEDFDDPDEDFDDASDDDFDDIDDDIDDASDEDFDNLDEDEEFDDADDEYLLSEAYRRRAKRVLTPEQREKKRAERIENFWNLVEKRRKQIRWLIVGLIVGVAALITGIVVRNWTFHSYKELVYSDKEDTLSASYANINGKILKYSVDGAMFVDHSNTMLWTISYAMNAPQVVQCGDVFAIYDSKGTSICICDESGQIGEVSADMPIVKVNVARQGVVAAILEDGQSAWIKSYTKDGSEIATLKTTFTNPGYPMDIALSEDGTIMAVDYLYIDNGTPVSRVSFYNFGTVGQNQKDNLVAETDYRDKILPEIEYLDEKNCVVFRENGFSLFTGSQIPSESVSVDVEQNIVSTFHDSEYIGMILQNRNAEKEYLISVYNKNGKEVLHEETDFRFQTVELNGGQIVLASRDEFCVYSMQGVEKYRGSLEVPASDFRGFGRNKFIYVSEDVFRIIQLG